MHLLSDPRPSRARSTPTAVVRRLCAVAAAVVVLASCRVDVTTSVEVREDGSGTIVVDAVADAELVEAAPGLADDLRLDDLVEAGWTIDGPAETADGGLRVVASHDFTGPAEASELLGQINGPRGPYRDIAVTRQVTDTSVSIIVDGSLGVDGGLRVLADDGLIELVGAVPWRDALSADDLELRDVLGVELVIGLPDEDGEPTSVTVDDGGGTDAVVITMPADGSTAPVSSRTVIDLTPDARSPLVAALAGVALLLWLVVSISFAVYVVRANRRRATARLRQLDR